MTDDKKKKQIEQANKAGISFSTLFYETMDKRRHKMSAFYMESATLVWNGNGVRGREDILRFYEALPTTQTQVSTVDAQPILDAIVQDQTTIHVHVSGQIRFHGKPLSSFFQTFMLTVDTEKNWKVLSDVFRLQEVVS